MKACRKQSEDERRLFVHYVCAENWQTPQPPLGWVSEVSISVHVFNAELPHSELGGEPLRAVLFDSVNCCKFVGKADGMESCKLFESK